MGSGKGLRSVEESIPPLPSSETAPLEDSSSPTEDDALVRTAGLPMLSGWQLLLSVTALCLGLFISSLETTIIATALVTIASDFGHFEKSSWIVVAYFLTYTGFLVIFTRMSDIFGRKEALLVAVGFFTLWSLASGLAQNIDELIVFRTLQGIGGSGIYSLAFASIFEITPLEYIGHASGGVGLATACSSILGPVLGGVITSRTTWRWVFWLNIPAGVFIIALVIAVFPRNIGQQIFSKALLAQVDWPGVILSLAGSTVLVFALESGGSQYAWNSAAIVVSFVISGLSCVAFTLWQIYLTSNASKVKMLPIFPTRLVGHRIIAAVLATGFLAGFPFTIVIINLPQRFQIVNGLSPVAAGIRVLPMLLTTAFSAAFTGIICGRKNISFYLLLLSNALQVIALSLLSLLPTSTDIPASTYGYEVILGLTFGMGLVCVMIMTRVEVSAEDNAVAMGAISQVRVLGGIIGLAIVQAILISSLHTNLSPILSEAQLVSVLASTSNISLLPPAVAQLTREAYGDAMNVQLRISAGVSGAALIVGLLSWRKDIIPYSDIAKGKSAGDKRASKQRLARNVEQDKGVQRLGDNGPAVLESVTNDRNEKSDALILPVAQSGVSKLEK